MNRLKQPYNDTLTEGDESSVSSLSDISSNSKRSKWIGKHNRANCLHCCRSKVNRTLYGLFDNNENNSNSVVRRKPNHSSLMQLSDISFNSPESVFSEECMPDRLTTNILRHVQRMANPVWSKYSKMALLEMKQKHPASFQDICLYSEVCKALSSNTYRLYSRRFLQELFLDLDFDSFNNEPIDIISRKERDKEINIATTINTAAPGGGPSSSTAGFYDYDTTDSNTIAKDFNGYPLPTMSSDHIYANVCKTHIKPPQLESVYETSVENLSESFGIKKSINNLIGDRNGKLLNSNAATNVNSETIGSGALATTTSSAIENENFKFCNKRSSSASNAKQWRPRFNTLELDLSCTKNKFPITDRRKKIQSLLQEQQQQQGGEKLFQEYRSLSSSVTTPTNIDTNNLFCEKRIKSSKSEATLSKSNEDCSKQNKHYSFS